MNGAESLLKTAVAAGVDVCFANPGTTEMPFVAAFDSTPGLRAMLCLFEGVATGAADGYARMAGRPALTLLHLGPGLANGLANLHNARRAHTPIVNIIGDHTTWHLSADAPLASDIKSLASTVGWVRSNKSAEELASDTADAIRAAMTYPGQVATLIVPHDNQYNPCAGIAPPLRPSNAPVVNEQAVLRAAALLRRERATALFLGGHALSENGLTAAARIAAVSGCKLVCETFSARQERGAGLPRVERLPYFPEQAMSLLSQFRAIILVGAKAPVSFFGYPGIPSFLTSPYQSVESLASLAEDAEGALEALALSLGAPSAAGERLTLAPPPKPTGPLTAESFAAAIASVQPEGAIIMDEGNTSSAAYFQYSAAAPRHSYLNLTGGAIGQGLPAATGAAVACPDRRVISIEADGSAMYTVQSLWTQAREGLDVTTVLCANHSYKILGVEMMRAGVKQPGAQAQSLIDLSNPKIDWVQMSKSVGVPATRVDTADLFVRELERALSSQGPRLIEVVL
ncbi:MAG TPA: acetolactate synthase large subunit [Blastocatellia bacterium]|jgi:acetolactate synthase-1/2/3 large subunit